MQSQLEPTQFTTRVKVTDDDYTEAVASNQYRCAISRAIWRSNPNARNVRVNRKSIAWTEGETRFVFPTPEVAIERIIRPLDTGMTTELKPLTIRLENGYVRPVNHRSDDELEKTRNYNREWKQDRIRRGLDNPGASGYERFGPNG